MHRPVLRRIGIVAALASLCLLGISAPAVAAEAKPMDKTLLGDWRFDEGAGDVAGDTSGHGNDGEIHGADWVKGKFGTALHFGGHDAYVSIPAIAGLDASNELTAEAWVYWEKGGSYPNIITGGTWCPGGFLFFVADNGCSFRLGKPSKAPCKWAKTGLRPPPTSCNSPRANGTTWQRRSSVLMSGRTLTGRPWRLLPGITPLGSLVIFRSGPGAIPKPAITA